MINNIARELKEESKTMVTYTENTDMDPIVFATTWNTESKRLAEYGMTLSDTPGIKVITVTDSETGEAVAYFPDLLTLRKFMDTFTPPF